MENKKIKLQALRRKSDFAALKARGHRVHPVPWMIINFRPTEEDVIRCGWTFPTYVGNAVTRNRLKRWGREEFAKWAAGQSKGKDINVVLRRRDKEFYKELSREEFNRAVSRIFRAFEKIDR